MFCLQTLSRKSETAHLQATVFVQKRQKKFFYQDEENIYKVVDIVTAC